MASAPPVRRTSSGQPPSLREHSLVPVGMATILPEVGGVLLGSALWWGLLCATVGALRTRFDARAQLAVRRVSALMLAGFALWQWGQLGL